MDILIVVDRLGFDVAGGVSARLLERLKFDGLRLQCSDGPASAKV
jgi:hypothetical protein